ncbi:unnamed protein product [Schistosoma mattheei]|uniref:ANK_REP_REGION domain-containing protein n=3 Tax=Schistosoma mattheei TaxID=31246 RepID=A0AA85BVX4_9TREM|nr:unnamed protein product [Schistosoma mattheei]
MYYASQYHFTLNINDSGSEKRDSRRPLTVRDVSLIRLAKNGDLDSIKQMIKEGVNINEQDETGWTVLHEACVRNLPRMVDYLLRHGADPSISNINGEMALHCAARVGCLRIVRALIYYNADPLVSNHRGEKPLDLCHDPEVSSFLKQHTETNQSHMLTSSGSGKSSHLKVRQHAHGTKHLMSSFSGTTISSSTEYYGGGGKDNSSIASPSNVCSDSEDDGHSHSGLSITANTSHHNISPINTNQQLDLNCLSSTGHHNHPTSSPSLSSVPKSVTDVHISSAKSLKKDPYAFEDDENDETVNNSGNSLLHSASGVNNSNNTNTQATGHIGVHSGCGVSVGAPANLNKSTSSNSTISSSSTTTITTTTTTTTTSVNTNTNTSPNSNISLGSIDSLSKHTRQLSSSNLSTTVECGNTTLDSNNDNTLTTLTGTNNSALTTTAAPNNSSNYTTSNNNCASIGGPPLRLRFAKEAGQYTLMEHQQQQIDLSLSNCDANLVPSSSGIICTPTEASHVTVISDSDNDNKNMNFQMDIDNNNNNNSSGNVSNEHNSNMGTSMTIKSEPITVSGDEELNHVSTSCHSESSGGEEISAQKVPPLRIKFASGTSGDESSSMTSSCMSVGATGGGLAIHPINNVENNSTNESNMNDKCDVKPRVSDDGLMTVNNKSDGKEVGVTVTSLVSTSVVSLNTPVPDKVSCSIVENIGDGNSGSSTTTTITATCTTETVHDQYSSYHEKLSKSCDHVVATNVHHVESSTELSISCTPPSTCITSAGMNTSVNITSGVNTVEMNSNRSNASNANRVKMDNMLETSECHGKSGNNNSNNNHNNNNHTHNRSNNTNNGNREVSKDTHRHRSGRTLRSHTAAQREKEEKERHTDDATPIKKRKLRSRSDTVTNHENISHQSRSGGGIGTANANNSPVTTVHAGSSTESSNVSLSSNAVANMDVIEDTHGCSTVTASSQSDSYMDNEEKKVSVGSSQSTVLTDKDTTDVHMTCVSEMEGGHSVSSSTTTSSSTNTAASTTTHTPTPTTTTTTTTTDNDNSNKMEVDGKPEMCGTAVSVVTLNMDGSNDVNVVSSVSEVGVTTVVTTTVGVAGIATSTPSSSSLVEQIGGCYSEADCDMSYLFCPSAPGDEDRKDVELLKFQNPYDKAAELNKNLRELVNNLVKVHPKAPCGYQDYLLVTRNYLLANQLSFATYVKRSAPSHLEATFVELFNEQEEERYAQALKHQSEREHLQLGAEQAVLRAQTRGALAVANQSKPYSFCSILSYNDLTYIPPVGKLENREEENIRDRFTPRTFIGWLQDIIDTFQNEKKKLLCRQLHEAESLMMVQKLDWEMKTRETLASNIDCIGVVDVFKDIPANYVPLIPVPNDFPLFAHDPVHRTTTTTTTTAAPVAAATTMSTTPSTSIPITPTTNTNTHTAVNNSPTVSATTTTLTNNS